MALILSQSDMSNLSWATVNKIEMESRRVQPCLRRLVLLSNTYHEYTLQVIETPTMGDNSPLFFSEPSCRNEGDSSSSDSSDEWEQYSDSDSDYEKGEGEKEEYQEYEDAPPPYSLYTSPGVKIQVSEHYSAEDDFEAEPMVRKSATYTTPFSYSEPQTSSSCHYTDGPKGEFSPPPTSPYKQLQVLLTPQLRQLAKGDTQRAGSSRGSPNESEQRSNRSRFFSTVRSILFN